MRMTRLRLDVLHVFADNESMNPDVYEGARGWNDEVEAERERARLIAQRIAAFPEVEEALSADDVAEIAAAREELARGEGRLVRPR